MKRKDLKRLSALLLCVIFVLSLIFSYVFIVKEADHDCSGEDCEICQLIDFCLDQIIKCVPLIVVAATIIAATCYCFENTVSLISEYKRNDPVLLKTRRNN